MSNIFEIFFIISAIILAISLFIANILFSRNCRNILSKCTPIIAIFLIVYFLSCLSMIIIIPQITHKFIMVLFAASPFIIGKFVTYKKLKYYSIIQILCVILSIVFVLTI